MQVEIGKTLTEETSEFIKERLLATNTRAAQSSLRKAIVKAKDKTGERVSLPTVINHINRYHPVSKDSYPILVNLLEQAKEI